MRRILELRGVAASTMSANSGIFRMAPGRTVDRADHRHLDFEEPAITGGGPPVDAVDALAGGRLGNEDVPGWRAARKTQPRCRSG